MSEIIKNCIYCNKEFTTTNKRKIFCSIKCCQKHNKKSEPVYLPVPRCSVCHSTDNIYYFEKIKKIMCAECAINK